MTVIAGAVRGGQYAVASDAAAEVNGVSIRCGSKVIEKGSLLIGYAGDTVHFPVLRDFYPPDDCDDPEDVQLYCEQLADTLRRFAQSHQLDYGIEALVASEFGIWTIDQIGAVDYVGNYFAIGSGSHVALGAMFDNDARSADTLVKRAVYAANYFVDSCSGGPHGRYVNF